MSYGNRVPSFARNRALILQVLNGEDGLTYEEISKRLLSRFGFLPTVGNRIRELRSLGIVSTSQQDGRLHVYLTNQEKTV